MALVQQYFCNIEAHIQEHPVILLSCNPNDHGWGDSTSLSWLKLVKDCQTVSAYIVRQDYVGVLMTQWRNTPAEQYIDQTWKPLQQKDNWAMTWPLLLKQG